MDSWIELEDGSSKRMNNQAHLEEDLKSLHEDFEGQSGIDGARAGTPDRNCIQLDISSPEEAVAYLKSIHS